MIIHYSWVQEASPHFLPPTGSPAPLSYSYLILYLIVFGLNSVVYQTRLMFFGGEKCQGLGYVFLCGSGVVFYVLRSVCMCVCAL